MENPTPFCRLTHKTAKPVESIWRNYPLFFVWYKPHPTPHTFSYPPPSHLLRLSEYTQLTWQPSTLPVESSWRDTTRSLPLLSMIEATPPPLIPSPPPPPSKWIPNSHDSLAPSQWSLAGGIHTRVTASSEYGTSHTHPSYLLLCPPPPC